MTLFNLDNTPVQSKLDQLIKKLSQLDKNNELHPVIDELKTYIKEQFKVFEELKYAFDQSTTITITDINGAITYVDDSFCQLTGYTKKELLKCNQRMLNSGYHNDAFFADMWDTIISGSVWNGEVQNKTKNGSLVWLQTTIVPILSLTGTPNSFIAFRMDITEKKDLKNQLVEALNDDYRKIFHELMNLVFRVRKNGLANDYYYTMIEGKLAKTLGISTERAYNKPIEAIYGTENISFIKEQFERVYEGNEVTFKHKLGDLYLYSMLSPIVESGKVVEVIGSSVDITTLEDAEQQIRYLAYHDPLTDLPNRSKLREDMELLIQQSDKHHPFAVLHCDIDRLKYINDALGQFAGDQVIQTIAKRLQEIIGSIGNLYHFGGDEFIAIIKGTHDYVDLISDEMIKQIKKPISLVGKEFFVTSSIGISPFYQNGVSAEELINHAGIAVHYCKVNGRNSKLFYSPKMNKMYNDILLLEGDVRRALNNDEFMLYYQPKISVVTSEVIGIEALIRWNHKERGFIPPSKFIPLAEETGLITQLGEWVIRKACTQLVEWMDLGYKPVRVAVNVSAIELQRYDFSEKVNAIIRETGMPPECLEIEITENSVMQNTEDCIKTMNELRAMGIALSIDDFGTGYSSFGYLRKFPINYLKIDQSFVKSALSESSSAEIIKAMIQLAHTFGLKVVAEGVEDQEVLSFIQEQNCDYYQGYFFSKPVPPEEIEKFM